MFQFQTDYMACDFPKIKVSREESVEITIEGVAKLISELPNGKSPGPDGICNPDMFIDLASTARCLSMLNKASLDSSRLPQKWKVANVTPVYKGGDAESVNNRRPISLRSSPCKMMKSWTMYFTTANTVL